MAAKSTNRDAEVRRSPGRANRDRDSGGPRHFVHLCLLRMFTRPGDKGLGGRNKTALSSLTSKAETLTKSKLI